MYSHLNFFFQCHQIFFNNSVCRVCVVCVHVCCVCCMCSCVLCVCRVCVMCVLCVVCVVCVCVCVLSGKSQLYLLVVPDGNRC